MEWLEDLITTFAQHGYLAVFVLMALESALIPIPSEVTMIFAGALASEAFATVAPGAPQLNVVALTLVGTVANLVGSWAAYGLGRVIGRAPLDRYGKYVFIRPHDIDRAEAWWSRHGQGAVFFGRLLPVVRTFISLPAGIAEMRFWRFTIYTFIGCLPWVAALTVAGYVLGDNWHAILGSFSLAAYAIAGLLALIAIAFVLMRIRRARAKSAHANSDVEQDRM
ncbi:MAG TPA: DedA family protein [Actinomycetota bacterium]